MRNFPLFVNMLGERVVIAGGGEAAAQKARLIGRSEAALVLMAPELNDELQALVDTERATHLPVVVDPDALSARLVISATGCAGTDAAIATIARDAGALVNVVDRPMLCNVIMPAIVDRDPVVVAIGTEGTAPVLARQIKSGIEAMLEPELGIFAAYAGKLRPRVSQRIAPSRRRAFWEWVFSWGRSSFAKGDQGAVTRAVDDALESGEPATTARNRVSLIDISGQEPDLLTLRALARLQGADLVIHDPSTDPPILDLARRDAERVVIVFRGALGEVVKMANGSRHVVLLAQGSDDFPALARLLAQHGMEVELVPVLTSTNHENRLRLAC